MRQQLLARVCAAGLSVTGLLPIQAAYGADAFGYTASLNAPFSYVNIASTGNSILAHTDDGTALIQIGFLFNFYGNSYSQVCLSTNGNMTLGQCPPNDVTNVDFSAVNPPGNLPMIAPLWTDLTFSVPGAGSLVYQTIGTAPKRRLVVQWNSVFVVGSAVPFNFETILFEGTNQISFEYEVVSGGPAGASGGANASIGIRGTDSQSNGYDLEISYDAPVLKNSSGILLIPPVAAPPVDVSADVQVTTSAFTYNRATQLYSGTISVTNISTGTLAVPLSLVLTQLTAGVTAVNALGSIAAGPFYSVSSSNLPAGQTATISVEFTDPSGARISFVPKTYSGQLQ